MNPATAALPATRTTTAAAGLNPACGASNRVEFPRSTLSRLRDRVSGGSHVTTASSVRGAVLSTCALVLALVILMAMMLTLPASAVTPSGTWITNTADIGYVVPATGNSYTIFSNNADIMVAQSDTAGPIIGQATASPSSTTNGNSTVIITVSASDSSAIDTVMVHLSPLGKSDSVLLRNDGVLPDTVGGDSIWNGSITIDTAVLGDTFTLTIIAIDALGNQGSGMVTLVVADISPSFAVIRSLGWNLASDVRIAGNAVSVAVGYSDTFSKVFFEYRPASGGAWQSCATGAWSENNPDTKGPYWGIYWNTDLLADDTYYIRATATRTDGTTDPSPGYLRVVKSLADSWIHEYTDTMTDRHIRRHRFSNDIGDTALLAEATSLSMTPASMGELSKIWTRITIFHNAPSDAPAPPNSSSLVIPGAGAYRRFEREDGQNLFADWVTISIPYNDESLTVPETELGIYRYDAILGTWVKEEEGFTRDTLRNVLTVRVRHFTDFAVFGVSVLDNLRGVLIYPNPFIPYDGDPQTGQPFVRGDNTTGIIFKNVTSTVDIDIYNVAGRRVSTIHASNTGGNVQWDAKTDDGREVASGVYVAVIRAPNGDQVVKKFMVIR